MLDELFTIHNEVMATTPGDFKRYLYDAVNWENQALCILGDRGVGKTTMSCQYLRSHFPSKMSTSAPRSQFQISYKKYNAIVF